MAVFEHDFSLNIAVKAPGEDPDDTDPALIIEALEKRITLLKMNREHWADYVEHYCTEDVTPFEKDTHAH